MPTRFNAKERRSFPRVKISASAIVIENGKHLGLFRIENLSSGGAALTGDIALTTAEELTVLVVVNKCAPIKTRARVVHNLELPDSKWQIGIEFIEMKAPTSCKIQELVLGELDRIRGNPYVLFLSKSKGRYASLERDILDLDRRVVYAKSPLEAAWLLQDPGIYIDTVVITQYLVGDDEVYWILDYLDSEYPNVRRVMLQDGKDSTNSRETHSGIQAVVPVPWDLKSLEDAILTPFRRNSPRVPLSHCYT